MKLIPAFLEETDEGTWLGHWLQGFAFMLIGTYALTLEFGFGLVAGAFLHREGSGFRDEVKKRGFRDAVRAKFLDGWMDLLEPFMGTGTALGWLFAGWGGLAGGIFGSAAFTGIVIAYRRRK